MNQKNGKGYIMYNKSIITIILCFTSCAIIATTPVPPPPSLPAPTNPEPKVFMNVNVQANNNTFQIGTEIINKMRELWGHSTTFATHQYHSLLDATSLCISALSEHKTTLFGMGVVIAYGALQWRITSLHAYLENPALWSLWRSNFSYDELRLMPRENLARDLIRDIQRVYINTENPADFVHPLTEFMKAVDHEQKKLEEYLSIGYYLNKAYITSFSLYKISKADEYVERLLRLELFKTTFLEWLAEYKLRKEE